MNPQEDTSKSKESKAGAGAAGIGGGTLLVTLANSLPNESRIKFWLILISPSVSVVLSVIWLWAQVEIANYMQDRKLRSLVKSIKTTLQDALNNPNTSEDHRNVIRKKLEEVEIIIADRELGKIRSLTPITFSEAQRNQSGTD
jgi:hypothetical protein